jgi:hypothetical protein
MRLFKHALKGAEKGVTSGRIRNPLNQEIAVTDSAALVQLGIALFLHAARRAHGASSNRCAGGSHTCHWSIV